jgi:hypothetical protein
VLVLFAGGVLLLLIVAALAFDAGMVFLERRDGQNAADAAALAGARYIFDADCDAANAWVCVKARAAATQVALANGYDDADPNEAVQIHIPPLHGRYVAYPNFIEVEIDSERPSIFAGVIGQTTWPVGVFAVATNQQDLTFEFSMLALNETACKAIHVSGSGIVDAYGNIQANSNGSDCGDGSDIGFSRTGDSEITIHADDAICRAAGEIQDQGSGMMTCTQAPGSFALPDPLRWFAQNPPPKPVLAPAIQPIGHAMEIPDFCPGSTSEPPTETTAQGTCDPGGGKPANQYRDLTWVLSPGLYPGGIHVTNDNVVYLLPGIYWIGGGGFQVTGDASVISIADVPDAVAAPTEAQARAAWGGGVLIYNSELPAVPLPGGDISLGGNGGFLLLKKLDLPDLDPNHIYDDLTIFQDVNVTATVTFNGSDADSEVEGIVYVPSGHVQVNGSSSTFILDQVIADTFKINGNGGTIQILKRVGVDALITAAGLVD